MSILSGWRYIAPWCYETRMRRRPFRRLVAAFAVFALLLAGLSASAVMAAAPCDMAMPMAADAPCDDGPQDHGGGDPDRSAPASLACFAKCPAPLPAGDVVQWGQPTSTRAVFSAPVWQSHADLAVAPPLHPPRT